MNAHGQHPMWLLFFFVFELHNRQMLNRNKSKIFRISSRLNQIYSLLHFMFIIIYLEEHENAVQTKFKSAYLRIENVFIYIILIFVYFGALYANSKRIVSPLY